MSGIGKSVETESELMSHCLDLVGEGVGKLEDWEVRTKMCTVSFWGNENILKLILLIMVQLC